VTRAAGYLVLFLVITACSDDPVTPAPEPVCFTQEVQLLIDAGCAKSGCHDDVTAADDITLITYEEIYEYRADIIRVTSNGSMPPPLWAHFSADTIALIQRWIDEGAKNTTCAPKPPDTTAVTYNNDIKRIIDLYCIGCHAVQESGSGPLLRTYEEVKTEVIYGTLLPVISGEPGYPRMPPGRTSMTENDIATFEAWVNQGMKE
jgi:mono/diheme cytochrome c family protein